MKRRRYYWIIVHSPDEGDTLIFGSEQSLEDARSRGLAMLPDIDFEIRDFPTRDLAAASSLYKGKKLETTHSLHKAKQRLVHEKGLARRKQRLEARGI